MTVRLIFLLLTLVVVALPQALHAESGLMLALGGGYNNYGRITGLGLQGALGYRTGPWIAQATFADVTYRTNMPEPLLTGPILADDDPGDHGFGYSPNKAERLEYAALLDLNYVFPNERIFVGGGHHFSTRTDSWYGSVGLFLGRPAAARPALRLNFGDDYVGAQATIHLALTR